MDQPNITNHKAVTVSSGIVLGIDPGAHGAIARLDVVHGLFTVDDMPTALVKVGKGNKTRIMVSLLAQLIRYDRPDHAYIEAVSARPGQGVTSVFAFGQVLGQIEGVLAALGVPVTYVQPRAWKKAFSLSADKGTSRARAMQLWPAQAALFARVKDDGRAEAALIGLYGLRQQTLQG